MASSPPRRAVRASSSPSSRADRAVFYVLAGLGLAAIVAGLVVLLRRPGVQRVVARQTLGASGAPSPFDFARSGGLGPGGSQGLRVAHPYNEGLPAPAPPPESAEVDPVSRYELAGAFGGFTTQELAMLRHQVESGLVLDPLTPVLASIPEALRATLDRVRAHEAYRAAAGLAQGAYGAAPVGGFGFQGAAPALGYGGGAGGFAAVPVPVPVPVAFPFGGGAPSPAAWAGYLGR